MPRLSRQTTPTGALLGASAGDASGMVHLGLGNFHRAHAAVYTAQALAAEPGEWGIHGFANRSRDVVDGDARAGRPLLRPRILRATVAAPTSSTSTAASASSPTSPRRSSPRSPPLPTAS